MTTPKPITGICPACGKRTVHRCISPGARIYQCRACGKTCDGAKIGVENGARQNVSQLDLFREEMQEKIIRAMAIATVELAHYNDALEAKRKARDEHESH